ncbi:MAG: hypothetical protein ACR2N3_08955 [Pyrinomonadaceae bacterium]
MKFNLLKSNFRTIGLGVMLAGGFVLVSSADAAAQIAPPPRPDAAQPRAGNQPMPRGGRAPRPAPIRDNTGNTGNRWLRIADEQGFRDGELRGTEDRIRNKRFKPEDASAYKKATNGYVEGNDVKDAYKNSYRQAFLRGYESGYNGREGGMRGGAMRGERPAPRPDRGNPRNARRTPRNGQQPAPPPTPNAPQQRPQPAPPPNL